MPYKVEEYISQLNERQRQAYLIAKAHLGSSFNVLRSNGYVEWIKKNKK
jgi:hypothetical protein